MNLTGDSPSESFWRRRQRTPRRASEFHGAHGDAIERATEVERSIRRIARRTSARREKPALTTCTDRSLGTSSLRAPAGVPKARRFDGVAACTLRRSHLSQRAFESESGRPHDPLGAFGNSSIGPVRSLSRRLAPCMRCPARSTWSGARAGLPLAANPVGARPRTPRAQIHACLSACASGILRGEARICRRWRTCRTRIGSREQRRKLRQRRRRRRRRRRPRSLPELAQTEPRSPCE